MQTGDLKVDLMAALSLRAAITNRSRVTSNKWKREQEKEREKEREIERTRLGFSDFRISYILRVGHNASMFREEMAA
jgi:hypothetical protein